MISITLCTIFPRHFLLRLREYSKFCIQNSINQDNMRKLHYRVPSLDSELIGEQDDDLVSFRGIPYATVTKRWTHSQVLHTLPSPFNAANYGPRCPQIESPSVAAGGNSHSSSYDHEFDCLNLNITVPTKTLTTPSSPTFPLLPVMVWVHR